MEKLTKYFFTIITALTKQKRRFSKQNAQPNILRQKITLKKNQVFPKHPEIVGPCDLFLSKSAYQT